MNLLEPLFPAENRVWRPYRGGMLLEQFFGKGSAADGQLPEDWLFSLAPAKNGDDSQGEAEGIGRVLSETDAMGFPMPTLLDAQAESVLGEEHSAVFGKDMAMRCKLIDTAEALGVQCCPPPAEGATIYEADVCGGIGFHVLDTRDIEGQGSYFLVGLREGVTPDMLTSAESKTLSDLMYRVDATAGETYFFPAGTPFMVGPGLLALQVSLAGDPNVVGPLPVESCLDVIDPAAIHEDDLPRLCTGEHILRRSDEGYYAELIGSERTTAFSLWRVDVVSRMHLTLPRPFAIVLCTSGEGSMQWAGGKREIGVGDCFLQPYGVPWIEYAAYGRMNLVLVLPPSATD